MTVMQANEWQQRSMAHLDRLEPYLQPHLTRRRHQEKHPVHDFMFTYYNFRPAELRRWHPGYGITLEGGSLSKGYIPAADGVSVDPDYLECRIPLIRQLHGLLTATASRRPRLSCFGLHEWAMVYRSKEHGTRHDWPLRLSAEGTDEVMERHPVNCSHFDAFRFFSPSARELNHQQPTADTRSEYEQPGCLHATMDLYKCAYRLSPMISSDLVADAFELAWYTRIFDMRAAPYDLTGVRCDPSGELWAPVRIETSQGKAEYAAAQRAFADRAAGIRAALTAACTGLLAYARDVQNA